MIAKVHEVDETHIESPSVFTPPIFHRGATENSGDRLTPQWIIDLAIEIMGAIDLDPCAEQATVYNVPALRHYTREHNGLEHEWYGRVYLNPPYGRKHNVGKWIDKLLAEYGAGRTSQAVVLLPARVETIWWRKLRNFPVCFVKGRVKFVGFETGAGFPSSLHYLGVNGYRFLNASERVGDVYVRWGAPCGNFWFRSSGRREVTP